MKKLVLLMFAILILGCDTETPVVEEPEPVIEEPPPVVMEDEHALLLHQTNLPIDILGFHLDLPTHHCYNLHI